MLTDCGSNVAWPNLNKASVKLNNGYTHLQQAQQPPSAESIMMDYESSSDAAFLEHPLIRDTSVLLLDVNQQQQPHLNIINNPTNSNLTSPQHIRNSISPISTSPTTAIHNKDYKSQVVVNLDYPNSMQTVTSLQRNNAKNISTKSNSSAGHVTIGGNSNSNNIKVGDNGKKMFNSSKNKYKFNLLKLSTSPSRAERSTRTRVHILAICLITVGIATGALFFLLNGIYHCSPDRIGMCVFDAKMIFLSIARKHHQNVSTLAFVMIFFFFIFYEQLSLVNKTLHI
jgi:hypothetical protein